MDQPNDMSFEQKTTVLTERMTEAHKSIAARALLAGGLPGTGWSLCIGSNDLSSDDVISMLAVLLASRVRSRAHAKELLNACLNDIDSSQNSNTMHLSPNSIGNWR